MVWAKTTEVMKEFVEYMHEDNIILYASNCDNTGWEHYAYERGEQLVTQKVGDRIVCVLMAGALFFMNWGSHAHPVSEQEDDTSAKITEHLRCIIAHMFSEVLNESVCRSRWGIFYAWYSMQQLGAEDGFKGGLIQQRKCGKDIFPNGNIGKIELNAKVKKWLAEDSRLKRRLQKVKATNTCRTPWQQGWKIAEFLDKEHTKHKDDLGITQIVHELKEGMKDIFKEIATQVEQGIQKREEANTGKSANDGKNGQTAITAATTPPAPTGGEKEKKNEDSSNREVVTKKSEVPPATVPEVPKKDVPEKKPSEGGAGSDDRSRSEDPPAGPVPQAPPPPQPDVEDKGKSSSSASPSSPDETATPAGTPGAGTEPTQNLEIPEGQASNGQDDSSKTNTTGVDNTHTDTTKVVDPAPVTTGNGSSASGGSKPDPPLADNTAKDDKAHDGHTAASSPTTQPSQESQPPKAPVTSTDPDQHGHTHDTGSSGAAGPTGPGSTGTGSTGTTNPRSSGTGSTGHQPPSPVPSPGRNNVQSTGSNGTNANKDPGLDLDFKPHADGIGGAYGPNAAPIDPHRTVISEHPPKGPGGPDGPDLTADVLTATTPILLFVASVIVAVLGYSLWKPPKLLNMRILNP
ncbi:hypothetical protein AK88_01937 [Plasmodium fragile]|uniref:Schizont-infected cell agglutination extracellular alpha domain-containing protein n=1 Tax=Plasmodium fragile TaxID=5857 RepID=A0A0D9QRL6_PLAFR|nr:uncharacterized protein AK88_01937 [Plasmodium fragile]KJP88321.1 hypothetical protein AK88_01937 [Plasmodium fragile]